MLWLTNEKHIVELLYSIYLGEELVHHCIMDTCATSLGENKIKWNIMQYWFHQIISGIG